MADKPTKTSKLKSVRVKSNFWILLVAAVALEAISAVQYFTSRSTIKREVVLRAESELRKAELEIEKHTMEMETAAKALALMTEKFLQQPDSLYPATQLAVRTLRDNTSLAVAFVPDYYPEKGRFYEVCSSRISEDSVYTRNIGSSEHDYTKLEWFQNGLVHDSCWWSEPYWDDSGSKTSVVSCSYPVSDRNGEVVAVVCVDMSLNYLEQVSDYLQIFEGSYFSISSQEGQEIVAQADTASGGKYMIFNEEVNATGWYISIIIPENILFADLRRAGLISMLLMLLGLVFLGFILYVSARDVKRIMSLNSKQERMENELEVAQTIQKAMLPKVFPPFLDRLDINLYGIVRPAKEIGGDLYDFYVRHDKLFFCIGDVSGKGIPASLVMATTRSLFRSITAHEERAAQIMMLMNNAMAEQNEQNMFVTLFLGVLDTKTGYLEYCNAGHNAPIIIGDKELCQVLPNLPLGIEPDFEYQSQSTYLLYGETLFLYTDGLNEAENAEHEQFGEERMMDALNTMITARPREMVEGMEAQVDAFVKGAPQSDDLTMLAIRYQTKAIVMRNDIQQIPTLAEWVDGLEVPAELNMPVNLALEEIVSNVMLYAYPKDQSGKVFVEFNRIKSEQGDQLIFTVSDSGIAFDPTQKPEVDTSLSAEEREIGGLGIHLVRQLMDEVRYVREDDKNILTLIKNI